MNAPSPGKGAFIAELKRRNVLRGAVLYTGVVWALAQGIAQLAPVAGAPQWVPRMFLVAAVVGFPFWIAFVWLYEITPQGVKRGNMVARDESIARSTGRKLDRWIIAVLAAAVVLLLTSQFVSHRDDIPIGAETAALRPIPEKSVAVLPFANDSGDKDQQYFSDGLSEDLINALSQSAGLKVISRNSAFQFRDSKAGTAQIGRALGVAHLLEGSVRRQTGQVRIIAQLVNAADGSALWSHQYDRPYEDLFALQDEIARAVADALKARLLPESAARVQSDRPPGGDLGAYAAYLHGRSEFDRNTEQSQRQAIADFKEAIRLDPRYADAYARLGGTWVNLAGQFLEGTAQQQAQLEGRAAIARALDLNPDSLTAHRAHFDQLLNFDMDWAGAEREAQRAVQLAPNDGHAKFSLGVIRATLGHVREAEALTRQALEEDPRRASSYYWLAYLEIALGRPDLARRTMQAAIALQPQGASNYALLAVVEILAGEPDAALRAARSEPPGIWRDIAMSQAMQVRADRGGADAALRLMIANHAGEAPFQIAQVYALRRQPDEMFQWLEKARNSRDPGLGNLLYDPFILRYRNDPRFAVFCRKAGLPANTDAKAMP